MKSSYIIKIQQFQSEFKSWKLSIGSQILGGRHYYYFSSKTNYYKKKSIGELGIGKNAFLSLGGNVASFGKSLELTLLDALSLLSIWVKLTLE